MPDKIVLCHMCGSTATHTCKLCGRFYCDLHYDAETGLCASCRRGRMAQQQK